ncbi:MAG TPA: hypothetical protein DCX67_00085 [Opitutae bacterium]|nr:hypothetical protein [Opitutae bacterium]|tara:strand:+ start:725 stop:1699 length:975 start_codon:yes stop_codon:yes gene_type:complete
MSLNSIGPQVNAPAAPAPAHQAIGRNGSFWLPEKLDQSFDTKVKNLPRGKDGGKPVAGKGNNPSAVRGGGKAVSTASEPVAGTLRPATGKTSDRAKGPLARPSTQSANGLSSSKLARSRIAAALTNSEGVKVPATVVAEKASPVRLGKNLRSLPKSLLHAEDDSRAEITLDPDAKDGRKRKGGRRGAKNASTHPKMENGQSEQDFQVLEGRSSSEPSQSPQARSFVRFLTKSVTPRISYMDKHAKKVVRFAIDLPNKAKLGVRLEKSGGKLSICLICSDPDSLEMIGLTKEALSGALSEKSVRDTQINVFNNYKEMDEHFSRAA